VELFGRQIGPVETNVYVLADARTREAIAIDTAIPSLAWISELLDERGWRLKLIVSTHGHWDHVGDNAAVQAWSRGQVIPVGGAGSGARADLPGEPEDEAGVGAGAPIAVHALDRHYLVHPEPLFAPFPIPPSVPAVDLAEGGRIKFGDIDLEVLHTPGHTEGSVCLRNAADKLLIAGDTLFSGSWGRTDLPGGSAEQMAESLARLADLDPGLRVLPGHGETTTVADELPWLERVKLTGRLPR
jgi:glyoxylase-like metal-dependent hydrolase (beta-lactamase superfamily II)